MRAVKKLDNYRMYKIGEHYELWHGKFNDTQEVGIGVRVGYVFDPERFEDACHEAEMEFRALARDFEIYG